MLEGTSRFGKRLDIALGWKEKLENAGFVDVEEKILKVRSYDCPRIRNANPYSYQLVRGRRTPSLSSSEVISYSNSFKGWIHTHLLLLRVCLVGMTQR